MPYYPKEQSNPISILVAQINDVLNKQVITVSMHTANGRCIYTLRLTQNALRSENVKAFMSLVSDEEMTYQSMYSYLSGILATLKYVARS